ncbi:hypothetical protein BaRGS_00029704 [Batillaria attramentaria]|uniref:Ig-like domain-containing protein n=1 Tax=Batillaria attramentaria TaxID=370345 RepID=A0ABD0JWB8_9CAEN
MGRTTAFFVIVCTLFLFLAQADETLPKIVCPAIYSQIGDDLECECKAPSSIQAGSASFSWTYLTKEDGPSAENVKIGGPDHFVTDGSKILTLYCKVEDVNPSPIITWLFDPCNHGEPRDNCSFQPNPAKDDNTNITYPPTERPVITGYTEGQLLKTGDKLTCTVTGGKPLVSKVIFSCTNPSHDDQEDNKDTTSVSSTLTIGSARPTNISWETTCTCSAEWTTQPDLYTLTASVSFALLSELSPETVTEDADDGNLCGFIGGIVGVCITIAVVMCVYFICKKRRARKNREDEESRKTEDDKSRNLLEKDEENDNTGEESHRPLNGGNSDPAGVSEDDKDIGDRRK